MNLAILLLGMYSPSGASQSLLGTQAPSPWKQETPGANKDLSSFP